MCVFFTKAEIARFWANIVRNIPLWLADDCGNLLCVLPYGFKAMVGPINVTSILAELEEKRRFTETGYGNIIYVYF